MLFSEDDPILIIGAGVSGLVLAQGLKHRGIPFRLFERHATLANRNQGYRFRCENPGLEALQQILAPELWDLVERTHAKHTPFVMVGLDTRTGEKVGETHSRVGPESRAGATAYPIDRPWFRELLYLGIEEDVVFGKAFESYELLDGDGSGKRVRVHFEDKTTATGRLLVAADGVRSRVRRQFLPDMKQVDVGRMVIWGRTPDVKAMRSIMPPHALSTWAGFAIDRDHPERSLLWAPVEWPGDLPKLSGGKLSAQSEYVNCVFNTETNKDVLANPRSLKHKLDWINEVMADWNPALKELYQRQDPESLTLIPMYSCTPNLPKWEAHPCLTFLGDSIHAMLPTGGIGGLTAILDARDLCLAIASAKDGDEEAWVRQLQGYETEMRRRGSAAIEHSFQGGKRMWAGKDWWEYESFV